MRKSHITSIIIDNESHSREVISLLLSELFPSIEVINQADGVASAVKTLSMQPCDIAFLDVEMDDGTGFEVLEKLYHRPKVVIFITAYGTYAIDAIRASAFDYILKPINREEFVVAVNRAIQSLSEANEPVPKVVVQGRVALPNPTGLQFVMTNQILYCEASSNYSIFYFTNKTHEVVSRTLGLFEADLVSQGFLRVHHRYLVNLLHVSAYQKGKAGGYLVMQDGSKIEVSTRRKHQVLHMFSS